MTFPHHPPTYYVKTLLLLLPIVGGAVVAAGRYRRLPPPLRCLAWLTWFELPLEIVAVVIGFFGSNNLFIMPIYTVGELALLALLYGRALHSAAFARWAPGLVGGFAAYALFDSLGGRDLRWYQPGQQLIQGLLILGMAALYFRQLLHELPAGHLSRQPLFWVSAGLVFYFVGYLHIALFSNYMLVHYTMKFNRAIWNIHSGLAVLLHSCYCVALGLRPPSPGPVRAAATA